MIKNFRKFTVYTFTVLVTKLVYDFSIKFLPIIKSTHNPYFDVAIGMGLTLIIFYPMYGLAHNWIEKFSSHYVKHARKLHRNNFMALLIAYIAIILLLFGCFMMLKFNINVIKELYLAIKTWVKAL